MALKTEKEGNLNKIIDAAKKYYVLNIKKFKQDDMCLCCIVYEGSRQEVDG